MHPPLYLIIGSFCFISRKKEIIEARNPDNWKQDVDPTVILQSIAIAMDIPTVHEQVLSFGKIRFMLMELLHG